LHIAFDKPLAPGLEIFRGDRKREVRPPAAAVARDFASCIDNVVFGRAGLKHQQHAARGDIKSHEARRLDQRPEPEQVAIKGCGVLEIARIERSFKQAVDWRRALSIRHRFGCPLVLLKY
jgi:hypothetical protein